MRSLSAVSELFIRQKVVNHHLVILKKLYLDLIPAGKKWIEPRFRKTKRLPFGQVFVGDKIFFKLSGGTVCAEATVATVKNFVSLTPDKIIKIKQRYNRQICGTEQYRQSKADCKFGFLVWLKEIKSIRPVRIHKKHWRAVDGFDR